MLHSYRLDVSNHIVQFEAGFLLSVHPMMKNRPPSQNIIHRLKLKSNKSRFNLASFLELRTNELDLVY